jgi:hypothetical protein
MKNTNSLTEQGYDFISFIFDEVELDIFKDVCTRLTGLEYIGYGNGKVTIAYKDGHTLYALGRMHGVENFAKMIKFWPKFSNSFT